MNIEDNKAALATKVEDIVDIDYLHERAHFMLAYAKKKGATQAEVGFSTGLGLNVGVRMQSVETLEFNRDKSVAITVFSNGAKGNVSCSDFSNKALESAVDAAINIAKITQRDEFAGLAEPADLAHEIKDLDLYHPWAISTQDAINLAIECESFALGFDKRIKNSDGASVSTSQGLGLYANSHGFCGSYPVSRHSLSCVVIASDEDNAAMERDYHYTSSRVASHLQTPQEVGLEAARNTIARLNARQVKTQNARVLFSSKLSSALIGHFTGAISGGRLYRNSSFLQDSIGQQVFPSWVSIKEDPHILMGLGSAPFDSDGVQTHKRMVVQNGAVEGYFLSAYSARKLNMKNTGHAGGIHNLIVQSSLLRENNSKFDTIDEQLQTLGTGLFVTELMGQGVNLVTGDYSRGASGFWVENGQIAFPVHEITISSNLKDMFMGILSIGNDIDVRYAIQTGSILIDNMMVAGS